MFTGKSEKNYRLKFKDLNQISHLGGQRDHRMDIQTLLLKLGGIPIVLIQVILIILLGLVVLRVIKVIVHRLEKRIATSPADIQQQARLKTLLSASAYVVTILVIFLATLMVLLAFGIDITPVLASLGVISLALSLGAQSLIKDFIGGILILMEDQFRVGDAVTILGKDGVVEAISLRSTRLRDVEGRLIILSNGDIREVIRAGYDWARAVVLVNGHGGNAAAVDRAVGQLEAEGRRVLAWWPRVAGCSPLASHLTTRSVSACTPRRL